MPKAIPSMSSRKLVRLLRTGSEGFRVTNAVILVFYRQQKVKAKSQRKH